MTDALPSTMIAIEISRFGPPEVLTPVERPVPAPGQGEVLVAVDAAGVNRPDVLQRYGKYPPPPGAPDIPGLEIAGTIVSAGSESDRSRIGHRVCALVAGGGYAEYCVAPTPQCLPVPNALSMVEGAAIPETFFTVWTNLFERGALRAGETCLIHGGASGIGTTAVQLARAFGAEAFTTARNAEKCAATTALGAARAINYREEDFVAAVREATGGRGVDVVLDIVGGDYVARNLDCLAIDGRLVQIAFLKQSRVEVDLSIVMRKRLTVTGSTLRPRSVAEKGAIAAALHDRVWPLLASKQVRPIVHETFPLEAAADAHKVMEADTHIGKLVLVTRRGMTAVV